MVTFKVYRYQLLPIDRHTDDMYSGMSTAEVIKRKNDLFGESLRFVHEYRHRGTELNVKLERSGNETFVLHLAPNRPLTRETLDSFTEQVDNWPHINAAILNRPDEQYILVQDRAAAFASTDTVVKLIETATRQSLANAGLRLHVEPMFSANYFWNLVEQYAHKITWVGFEFITPNMANISASLSDELKKLSKETNAAKSDLQLTSDASAALNLSQENETVNGLVEYTSQGGGDITLKVKGIRKHFHTSHSPRTVEISELEVNVPPDQLAKIFRELLK